MSHDSTLHPRRGILLAKLMKLPMAALMDLSLQHVQSERDDAREIGARVRSLTHLCTFIAISIEIQDKSPSESRVSVVTLSKGNSGDVKWRAW